MNNLKKDAYLQYDDNQLNYTRIDFLAGFRWDHESLKTVLGEEDECLWLLATNELQMREE